MFALGTQGPFDDPPVRPPSLVTLRPGVRGRRGHVALDLTRASPRGKCAPPPPHGAGAPSVRTLGHGRPVAARVGAAAGITCAADAPSHRLAESRPFTPATGARTSSTGRGGSTCASCGSRVPAARDSRLLSSQPRPTIAPAAPRAPTQTRPPPPGATPVAGKTGRPHRPTLQPPLPDPEPDARFPRSSARGLDRYLNRPSAKRTTP